MNQRCHFCGSQDISDVKPAFYNALANYKCPICGPVRLQQDSAECIDLHDFSVKDKKIISICLRNAAEEKGHKALDKQLTITDLDQLIKQYHDLDALDKMDKVLENIDKKCEFIGQYKTIDLDNDFPYYHCYNRQELLAILLYLHQSNLIESVDETKPRKDLRLTPKGYEQLREIKRARKDSRQCFVAMWFSDSMRNVYEKAIQKAIEYLEEGQSEPKFKALSINMKEHTNDINDEIISEIRRSRFMVCDLTGYRGGVYWEAGFARGLGLDVFYTCRKDWVKAQETKCKDHEGNEMNIVREGIHFDLEHMNRIEWDLSNLEKLRDDLTKRIKAAFV